MADVSIQLNREVREEGKPFEEAMQLLADAIEGFFAYKLGDPDINKKYLETMQWAALHLAGLVSRERPIYDFGYSAEQDAELMELMTGTPFPLPQKPRS